MASLAPPLSTMSTITFPLVHSRSLKLWKFSNAPNGCTFPYIRIRRVPVCCSNLSPWEPSPVTYAPTNDDDDGGGDFLKGTTNIFETLNSDKTAKAPVTNIEELTEENNQTSIKTAKAPVTNIEELTEGSNQTSIKTAKAPVTNIEELTEGSNQTSMQLHYLKWPMWLLGPSLLLATGMAPTLWLPITSIFLGPNIASLLSLTGLDCIFNLGTFLFLLMADSCARPRNPAEACSSKAPFSYRFWNMVATTMGVIIPLVMLFVSQKGVFQPQLPSISFAILLGPYLLLLSVQMLTEMLTWHWQSPVWLVTPVIYEAYRVLQLMRGLKLGVELSAPAWMMHTIRGLVCWWVLILGMQLMRVAWYAGFSARARRQKSSAFVGVN